MTGNLVLAAALNIQLLDICPIHRFDITAEGITYKLQRTFLHSRRAGYPSNLYVSLFTYKFYCCCELVYDL